MTGTTDMNDLTTLPFGTAPNGGKSATDTSKRTRCAKNAEKTVG